MFWPEGAWLSACGNTKEQMIEGYIADQQGEPIHDASQFVPNIEEGTVATAFQAVATHQLSSRNSRALMLRYPVTGL
jgi:hypothetical protein